MAKLTSHHAEELQGQGGAGIDAVSDALADARLLRQSGAWTAVHDLLFEPVRLVWSSGSCTSETIEATGILQQVCAHLGHGEHCRAEAAFLRQHRGAFASLTPEVRATALLALARDAIDRGEREQMRLVLQEAASSLDEQRSQLLLVGIYLSLARLEAHDGNLRAAERAALEAVSRARQEGCQSMLGDTLIALGNVLHCQRRLMDCQGAYAHAASAYGRASDPHGRTLALLNRAGSLVCLGRYYPAQQLYRSAWRAASEAGREASKLRALLGVALTFAKRGHTARARALLLSAWRKARRLSMPRDEALALEFLTEAYLLSRHWESWLPQARVAGRRCAAMIERIAPHGDVAIGVRIKTAMIYLAESRTRAAISCARDAARMADARGFPLEKAEALRVLGTIMARSGRREDALEAFRASHEVLAGLSERFQRAIVEKWLWALGEPVDTEVTDRSLRSMAERDGLRYWLNHSLIGPPPVAGSDPGRRVCCQKWLKGRGQMADASPRPPLSADAHACTGPHPLWSSLGLLTRTPELIDTLRLAETYAPENIPTLILGETGTGKDLLAQGIHQLSQRKGRYVPVNCAAAQRDLFAAELFGARKGAYTGAIEHREGLVREAEGGTLFFDEIADLNCEAQGYLLRFLDSGEIRPLGESKSFRVETRIVAATCRDLDALATQSQFRHDLHARLAAVVLTIPPLRHRTQDLEALIDLLWERRGGRKRDRHAVFTSEVLAELSARPWPGNVRELAHLVARLIPLVRTAAPVSDDAIGDLLRAAGRGWPSAHRGSVAFTADRDLTASPHRFLRRDASARWPRAKLLQALDDAHGHVPTAARILGLSRSQAYRLYRALKDQG